MRPSLFLLLMSVGLSCVATPATAQTPPQAPAPVFDWVFPHPTGQNGYEELVKAGDILAASAEWKGAEQKLDQLTLAAKRQLISDTGVKRALMLLKAGLSKPITSPRQQLEIETLLPEFPRFRSLGRLISLEIYLELADGKTGQAIDTLAQALDFGYAIQTDTTVAGLVGIVIDTTGIKMLSDHLDQLSARDCDRVVAVTKRWLELPDPSVALMANEREITRRAVQKYRNDPQTMIGLMTGGQQPSKYVSRLQELGKTFSDSPGSSGPVFDEAGNRLSAFYDRALDNFKKPIWERTDLEKLPQDDSPAGALANLLAPLVAGVSDRFGREQALVQILGVHAAVRRYRWEQNKLPESLGDLRLGRLETDPFTGKPLSYKKLDEKTYELSSAGPVDRREDALPGARVPVK